MKTFGRKSDFWVDFKFFIGCLGFTLLKQIIILSNINSLIALSMTQKKEK